MLNIPLHVSPFIGILNSFLWVPHLPVNMAQISECQIALIKPVQKPTAKTSTSCSQHPIFEAFIAVSTKLQNEPTTPLHCCTRNPLLSLKINTTYSLRHKVTMRATERTGICTEYLFDISTYFGNNVQICTLWPLHTFVKIGTLVTGWTCCPVSSCVCRTFLNASLVNRCWTSFKYWILSAFEFMEIVEWVSKNVSTEI